MNTEQNRIILLSLNQRLKLLESNENRWQRWGNPPHEKRLEEIKEIKKIITLLGGN